MANVIKRIESLFEGHYDLIKRFFDEFLPSDQTAADSASGLQDTKGKHKEESGEPGTESPGNGELSA